MKARPARRAEAAPPDAQPDRLRRAEEVVFQVLALPEAERDAAVARLCGPDPAWAADVLSLLAHADRLGAFLETPALGTAFTVLPALASAPPAAGAERDDLIGCTLGRYRIERRIASGGMGTVYLGRRADEQFTQRVAIKLVKRGMDSDEILQRFRRERQTLAALEHPNIARLIDGGATRSGQPYLVMELVLGEPIDAWCDHRQLPVDERLELFLVVCDAVRHAHQHLVVHRDLKPSNILVTADGTPKLLDFGIATVLDEAGTPAATSAHERRLTPEYASPEQIAGSAVGTTSDVYSLGAILCELLTGRTPYVFETRTVENVRRVVSAGEPRAPSELSRLDAPRVASLDAPGRMSLDAPGSTSLDAARARRSTPEKLVRRLRGDLDTIVLAALRQEPDRRYPSVERLAADVRRHLDRLPVTARRDTLSYRAGKFARRHALATALAALTLLSLVAGGAAFAWQARMAERQRDQALVARAQSEAVTSFLDRMLSSADPSHAGPGVTVHEVLDDAAQRVESELSDQPLVEASLRSTIGRTYLALGLYGDAEAQLRIALRRRMELLGPRHLDSGRSMADLASVLYAVHALDEAALLLEESAQIFAGEAGAAGAEHASAISSLGAVRRAQGDLGQAERLQRAALELRRGLRPENRLDVAESLNNLAGVLMARGELAEARPLLAEALACRQTGLGPDHPLVAQSTDNLAVLLHRAGELELAEPLYRQALELETRILGPGHPDVAVTRRSLALLLVARGCLSEAEDHLRRSLAGRERTLPAADVRRVVTALDLAEVLLAKGQGDDAEPLVAAALDATRELDAGAPPRDTALARAAVFFERCGQAERAAELRAQRIGH